MKEVSDRLEEYLSKYNTTMERSVRIIKLKILSDIELTQEDLDLINRYERINSNEFLGYLEKHTH